MLAGRKKEIYGTKFADEELNGMIIPTTGAPREIGGYALTTPMTNAYPLVKAYRRRRRNCIGAPGKKVN